MGAREERLAAFDRLPEHKQIAVRDADDQLPLAVRLIDRPQHVAFGQGGQLFANLVLNDRKVANVDVIGKASVRDADFFGAILMAEHPEPDPFPIEISVIGKVDDYGEAEDVCEEAKRSFKVVDMHEGCDLEAVGCRHGVTPK